MKKIIAFDMDGTIANLYAIENWLDKLISEDPSPYTECDPLTDMVELNRICGLLHQAGYEIMVITAYAKAASPEYKNAIREAKRAWLKKWNFLYDYFYGIDYTDKKADVVSQYMKNGGEAILVDDEIRHREKWIWGKTIDPTEINLLTALNVLLRDN